MATITSEAGRKTKENALKRLELAYELLGRKSRWTRGALAKDGNGRAVRPKAKTAERFCALGAIQSISIPGSNYITAKNYLNAAAESMFYDRGIVAVNDENGDTGYRKVRKVYRRAMEMLRKELGK